MPQTSSIALGPMPVPTQAAPGERVGGGDERIGAVVDVEHRALRALEDHPLAVVEHLPHQLRGVGDVLLEAVAVGEVFLGHRVQVERRVLLERPQRQPLGLHRRDDLLLQDLLVEQVLDADAQARRLVGVAGADAPARRADLQAAEFRLAGRVEQQVVGHDQVRVGGDAQAADVDAAARAARRARRSAPSGRSPRRCRSRSACPGRGSRRGSGAASTPRRRGRSCGRRCCRPGSARPRRRARRAGR